MEVAKKNMAEMILKNPRFLWALPPLRDSKKLNVLELYSGTQSIGSKFRKEGHNVVSIELNPIFLEEPYNLEQWTMSVGDLKTAKVLKHFGGPVDVIWASPLCTTHSVAAISRHRRKGDNGLLVAHSDKAREHDDLLLSTLQLIGELKPKYWFLENPRGGMRKSNIMQGVFYRHTTSYCQWGDSRMKPTDIWTNHPNPEFKEACSNGDPCHEAAPRGARTGTQGLKGNTARSVTPEELCQHIVNITTK